MSIINKSNKKEKNMNCHNVHLLLILMMEYHSHHNQIYLKILRGQLVEWDMLMNKIESSMRSWISNYRLVIS